MCYAIKELIRQAQDEGHKEGRMEGREEGRMEGREEGRMEGREEGRNSAIQCMAATMLSKSFPREQIVSVLTDAFSITPETARAFLA